MKTFIGIIDEYVPERKSLTSNNVIAQPWMTKALITSSNVCELEKGTKMSLTRTKTLYTRTIYSV